MGAADLDHVPEFHGLLFQRRLQIGERGQEGLLEQYAYGHVDGGGDDVVARLAHVHVVVRVDGLLAADGLTGEL
ncbi:MAG: hypothetical protein WDN28_16265 [Chthoniobacter sp.]